MKFNATIFGEKIKEKRIFCKMSIRDLSAKTFISPATLCRIENGLKPDIDNALALAHWYGVDLYFFTKN